MSNDKIELKGLFPEELAQHVSDMGLEGYRTRQLVDWLYNKGVTDFESMTNLSKAVRVQFENQFNILNLNEVSEIKTPSGDTIKFLFGLPDGRRIESVLMWEGKRRTLCVSSQVGCPLDCQFCATGRMGLIRNLGAAEIVEQVLYAQRFLRAEGDDLTNVVMMGMGEPLLNFDEMVRAIRLMNLDYGAAIGIRRITLSTAGHVPGIQKLAQEGLKIGLAVSLNASTDEQRSQIMPINRKWPIRELLAAVKAYYDQIGRWITFEYVLLHGLNDTLDDARRLVNLVREIPCKINVIPWNPIEGSDYERPPQAVIGQFVEILANVGLTVTVRYSKGDDIAAGCGQLYQEMLTPSAP
ncbi:MAG: 23S rRNA (adenine(2503)-C(2))-methyltransferase RlmN [Candidatus Latescibacteria bacterium]|nr:23S rRNA (adenine(2503)-C(2))-methyltransferase RlmN [Candidatus Latescibacterota bacterium]